MNLAENLSLVGILVTAIGSVAAVVGIAFIWLQVRASQKIAKGEFVLNLSARLSEHEATYRCLLTPGWVPGSAGVTEADVQNYISLFEQFKILIDYGIIDLDVFERLFGHRLIYIILNDFIYQDMLMNHPDWWPDFIALCELGLKLVLVDTLRDKQLRERLVEIEKRVKALVAL